MKTFVLAILLIAFGVAIGCQSGRRLAPEAENAVFVHLNRNPAEGILIVSDDPTEQVWYTTRENRSAEKIRNVPETSMYNVWQARISPGDEYLAVLSEGEGHPVVDIFELNRLFSQAENAQKVSPLLSIDPYPGTIWIRGWQGDTTLVIESDVPLDLLDSEAEKVRIGDPWQETRQFLWNIVTDTVRRK